MKKSFAIAMTSAVLLSSCVGGEKKNECNSECLHTPKVESFNFVADKFADLEVLRYRVPGIESLSLKQQELVYYLSEAALCGRDILFDQNGKYNLEIRNLLEAIYTSEKVDKNSEDFKALELYLKRFWVSNGIHHHYSGVKFETGFSQEFFTKALADLNITPATGVLEVIFNPEVAKLAKNQAAGEDLLLTSASNYYEGVTQAEALAFYDAMKVPGDQRPISYGLNSKLTKINGELVEQVYKVGGMYSKPMTQIVFWLEKALAVTETEAQRLALEKLITFYKTGDLKDFDDYAVAWTKDTESLIDLVCGYTETYGDPLGLKASWEAIINFKNLDATKRTDIFMQNVQWFEDNSPVDKRFKKEEVKGVSAKVINAIILGGDCYPTSPLGINLPNSNWIRAEHGSKSVTIENIAEANAEAGKGGGFSKEFVWGEDAQTSLDKYGFITGNMHTDIHELGHGSGKLLPGVDPDALKEYGAVIEECRADLFALYFMADDKIVELGLLEKDAYKAAYYQQMMNGLMTQTTRIKLGSDIEQTHMRNRQTIAYWVLNHAKEDKSVEMVKKDGKTYLVVNDYAKLRQHFGAMLAEIQRIKSEGDYPAAKAMVEKYGIKINQELHKEILDRYAALNMAPYKAYVNPVYKAKFNENGKFQGLSIDYTEGYADQHLRYSKEYSF